MKKHHWHAFWYEKLFENHPQPHCQTRSSLFPSQKKTNILVRTFFTKNKTRNGSSLIHLVSYQVTVRPRFITDCVHWTKFLFMKKKKYIF